VTDGATSGLTTTYDYWPSSSGTNAGQIQRVIHPDGSWSLHGVKLNETAQTTTDLTVTPFGSTPPPGIVADFAALQNIANANACVEEEVVTRNTADAATSLPAGFMLSRERRISSPNGSGGLVKRIVSRRQLTASGFYEDLNTGRFQVSSGTGVA